MKNLIRYFFIFLLLTITLTKAQLQAQNNDNGQTGTLTGKVIDSENGEGVDFATVSIYSAGDTTELITGGISDLDGAFRIEGVPFGVYRIKFSFIGYQTSSYPSNVELNAQQSTVNLGEVSMNSDAQQLEEVSVEADKDLMINSIDKRTYNVTQDATAEGGDATDALSNLPSVDVDIDGNVSLRGSEGVKILIDGRESVLTQGGDLSDALEQIPSSSIESIEVITNPSAKYNSEGTAGIINIILKKNERRGTNGAVSANIGTRDKYNTNLSLNRYVGKLNLFGSYGFRSDRKRTSSNIFRQDFENGQLLSQRQQDSDGFFQIEAHSLAGGADYSIDDKNTLSLSGNYNANRFMKQDDITTSLLFFGGRAPEFFQQHNSTNNNRHNGGATLNYEHKFDDEDKLLTASASYSQANSNRNSFFGDPINIQSDSRNDLWQIQGDYSQTIFDKMKLESGIYGRLSFLDQDFRTFLRPDNQSDFFLDPLASFNFTYNEQVYAAYGTVSGQLNNNGIGYQLGLRAEQAFTTSALSDESAFHNNYFTVYPTVHLSKGFGEKGRFGYETEVQLSYSRRVNRPQSRALNPFVDLSDPTNISTGNPFLLPEFVNALELSYIKNWEKTTLTVAAYYRHSNNPISRVTINDPITRITTRTFENLASSDNYGFEFLSNTQLTDWWNINANVNFFYFNVDGSNFEGFDFSNHGFSWIGKLMSSFDLWEGGIVQLSARYRSPKEIPAGRLKGFVFFDVAMKQKVLDGKGTVNLRFSDPFNLFKFRIDNFTDEFFQSSIRKRETQIVYLGFSYNFGNLSFAGKKKRGQRRESGNTGDDMGDMY